MTSPTTFLATFINPCVFWPLPCWCPGAISYHNKKVELEKSQRLANAKLSKLYIQCCCKTKLVNGLVRHRVSLVVPDWIF